MNEQCTLDSEPLEPGKYLVLNIGWQEGQVYLWTKPERQPTDEDYDSAIKILEMAKEHKAFLFDGKQMLVKK